ncbi:regulatory protein ArsR [Thermovibrio ammonificans HB-1]|uniref:Regulatory protein ArsR n=1 Tax=Thermovibrio ammonificans (strain DSM 15698 / JCM 12110 / HB-1) TaxID=648996 RepID=E8T339_THEA1|nr:metalloregulator ArsR/SmtB family transcription factor [Thermovibrio ammonificans]ADU96044.1 regulatory protein ArsR [Thermovibrio ammonificans HB-1]
MKFERFSEAVKILGDRTRLRLIRLLMERPVFVCEASAVLGLSTPTVSVHFSKLKQFGFVKDRKEGQKVMYSLAEPPDPCLKLVLEGVLQYLRTSDEFDEDIERLKSVDISKVCPYEGGNSEEENA